MGYSSLKNPPPKNMSNVCMNPANSPPFLALIACVGGQLAERA